MKLITCDECRDLLMIVLKETRVCRCGETGGKYLDDGITAVVNTNAIVVGIDNNGFNIARQYYMNEDIQNMKGRVDFFFTGWIPNHPGEVIKVPSVEDVILYDYHIEEKDRNYTSTSPAEVAEQNESGGGIFAKMSSMLRRIST